MSLEPISASSMPPAQAPGACAAQPATVLRVDIHKTLRTHGRAFRLGVTFATTARRLVLYGPSGAGKSLTLQAIAGLLRPDGGRIELCGRPLFDSELGVDLRSREREVGYLFQDYALFPHLTVRQNVAFGLEPSLRNPRRAPRDPRVEHWLAAMGMDELADHYPSQLSGGQRQRTALARALVCAPRALLLDEPFAALDRRLRARLSDELDALQRRLDIPMVLVTHDAADVERFGDDLLEIDNGRALARELREPRHEVPSSRASMGLAR